MERQIHSMDEISDGKLYGLNDMVKADCQDCRGCSACCRGMGNTIQLDPFDICRMENGLGKVFEELLQESVELTAVQGVILPSIRMNGTEEKCSYLNAEGRCTIHPFRPGICRLFPLGRIYENGGFQYFLQTGECRMENRTKVKVRKWIDTGDLKRYEKYICDWHYFIKELQNRCMTGEEGYMKKVSMDRKSTRLNSSHSSQSRMPSSA